MAGRSEDRNGSGLNLGELEQFTRNVFRQAKEQNGRLAEQQTNLNLGYIDWLAARFPHAVNAPFGARHLRLWEWFDRLEPGVRPRPQIEIWPRGGGKSTTAELGVCYAGVRGKRRYALYVSGTQEQADKHVSAIATLFEKLGLERAIGRYGNSKGWRRNQLRVANGFNCEALGLDTAARGIKLDEFRPDLLILDDLDDRHDTPKTIKKKSDSVSTTIIPAGSNTDCAILGIQNLIHEESLFSRMQDGRADFLLDRSMPPVEEAVRGLRYELYERHDGANVYRITAGEPTWEGQSIAICEQQINAWGLRAFLREAQQEVRGADGYFFDSTKFQIVEEIPSILRLIRAWDLAATQGGGDYTVGVLMGLCPNGRLIVLDVVRAQLASDNVRELMDLVAAWDRRVWGRKVRVRITEDPGQAGKDQARQLKEKLAGSDPISRKATGSKADRATTLAEKVNSANVDLLSDGRPRCPLVDALLERMLRGSEREGQVSLWTRDYIEEHRKFREDGDHDYDDQIDPSADACNELVGKKLVRVLGTR